MVNKISSFITKNLVIWVLLCVFIGYVCLSVLVKLKPYNEWFFTFTMFGIGFVLNFEDFVYVFKKFYIVLLGTLAQFLIMPLGGYLVGQIFSFPQDVKLGFYNNRCSTWRDGVKYYILFSKSRCCLFNLTYYIIHIFISSFNTIFYLYFCIKFYKNKFLADVF